MTDNRVHDVVQGTVAGWSSATRAGSILLDDGTLLEFDAGAFDVSGLRLLRFGQRVHARVDTAGGQPRVTVLTIVTLPLPAL